MYMSVSQFALECTGVRKNVYAFFFVFVFSRLENIASVTFEKMMIVLKNHAQFVFLEFPF